MSMTENERLTKRNSDGSVGISEFRYYNYDDFQKLTQKLAKYEDIGTIEELQFLKQWKSDVMEEFCRYDTSSVEEIVLHARNRAITEFAERLKGNSIRGAFEYKPNKKEPWHKVRTFCRVVGTRKIDEIAEEMRGAE